jgi:SAM-dependent methyltransferase
MRAAWRAAKTWLSADAAELRRFVTDNLPSTLTGIGYDIGAGYAPYGPALVAKAPGLQMVNIDLHSGPSVSIVADMCQLPVSDSSAALATFFESLQYAAEPEQALAEARRVLRPDGVLLWAYPFLYPEGPDHSLYRWTAEGARRLVERAGFTVIAEATRGGAVLFLFTLAAGFMIRAIPGWRGMHASPWRRAAATLVWLPWQFLGRLALLIDRLNRRPAHYIGGVVLARRKGD